MSRLDMSYLVHGASACSADLSDWDTSSVTQNGMLNMFLEATAMTGAHYNCPESPASLDECAWPVMTTNKARRWLRR